MGNIVAQGQRATLGLGGLGAAGGALISGFVDKAAEMEGFLATLTALTGDANLAKQKLQEMADFAATTPFDLPGVVSAGTVLAGLKLEINENLPRIGNLASVMRRDLSEAALIFAKSMNGSRDGLQSLFDAGVTTKDELDALGANLDKSGAIAVEGAANIEALQGALTKLVDTKFGGVMAEQSKTLGASLSTLSDSIGQVQATIGSELAPSIQSAAQTLTQLIDGVRTMDPFLRSLVANGLLAVTMFGAVGAAVGAVGLALGPAMGALAAYRANAQAAAAANLQLSVAAHAKSVATVVSTEADVAAAAALVAEAQAARANATTKAASIAAAEALAIAETELAAATEAAAIANAQYSSTAAGVGTAMGANTVAAGGLSAAMKGLLFSVGGLATAIGLLVGGGLLIATAAWKSYTDATEKQIEVGEQQLTSFRAQKEVVLEAATAVRQWGDDTEAAVNQVRGAMQRMGKDDLDVTRAIAGNAEMLKQLREQLADQQKKGEDTTGTEKLISEYERRNEVLIRTRATMRGMHDAEVEADRKKQEALKAEQAAAEALIEAYRKKSSQGQFGSEREQLAALDELLAKIGKQNRAYEDLAGSRVRLARQAAEEEKQAEQKAAQERDKIRKDALAEQMHAIDLVVGSDQAAISKRIALMQQLLAGTLANKEERRRIEVDLARETEALEKAKADAAKKAAQDKIKADQEAAKARQQLAEAEKKMIDATLGALQEQFAQGEAVLPQIEAQLAKRLEIEAALEREKAAHESLGKSAAASANIRKAAEAEIQAMALANANQLQKLRDQAAKRQADATAKDREIEVEKAKLTEASLKAQLEAGARVGDQLKKQMEQRQAAERQLLVDRAQAAAAGASAEDRLRIRKDLELDLLQLSGKQTEEARKLTEELEKQKAAAETKNGGFTLGGVSGVEGAGDFSAFDTNKSKGESDLKKTIEDQKKSQEKANETLAKSNLEGGAAAEETIAYLAKIAATLEAIHVTPNTVTVKTGAGGGTSAPDWRLETNKTGA